MVVSHTIRSKGRGQSNPYLTEKFYALSISRLKLVISVWMFGVVKYKVTGELWANKWATEEFFSFLPHPVLEKSLLFNIRSDMNCKKYILNNDTGPQYFVAILLVLFFYRNCYWPTNFSRNDSRSYENGLHFDVKFKCRRFRRSDTGRRKFASIFQLRRNVARWRWFFWRRSRHRYVKWYWIELVIEFG